MSFSFFENCMDVKHDGYTNNRIFPIKGYSSILNRNYKTIDFSEQIRRPPKINVEIVKSSVKPKTISPKCHEHSIACDAVIDDADEKYRCGNTVMKHEMPIFDNLIADNTSESENGDVIVKNYSCDSSKLSEENIESRIPLKILSNSENVNTETYNVLVDDEKKIKMTEINCLNDVVDSSSSVILTKDTAEIKSTLNVVNEFISIELPVQLDGSDENDVVVKIFKPKRKRSRSLGHRKQVRIAFIVFF